MTFVLETIRLGLTNLRLHKMRSLLTMLGIIFAVVAVIVMVAIGEGNKRKALAEIRALGAENIILRSVKPAEAPGTQQSDSGGFARMYGLKRLDLARIEKTVAPLRAIVPFKNVSTRVVRGALQAPAQAYGTLPLLARISDLRIARGRFLSDLDQQSGAGVAVLGATVAQQLFPLSDPLDQTVHIEELAFRVIGVLAPLGGDGSRGASLVGRDLDRDVYLPLSTAQNRFGDMVVRRSQGSREAEEVELHELIVQVDGQEHVPAVAEQIRRVIDLDASREDVSTVVPLELLRQAERTQRNFNYLMIAIAGISLVVGGIGIMNIMLATVTERTREIGIRRAVGAQRRHIIAQFLVETTVLSICGGLLGVALGSAAIPAFELARRTFPSFMAEIAQPSLTLWSVLLSFAVAAATGIVFGLYPAIQASKQDPIVALRHD